MNFQVRAFIIGGVTLVFIIFVFLWMVVFNKATIAVSGEGIYEMAVSGDGIKGIKTVMCTENPCVVSVPTGQYTLDLTRAGYRDEQRIVTVDRGSTETVFVEFRLIPKIADVGTLKESDPVVQTAFEAIDLDKLFSIDMDSKFNKQRLNFYDETMEAWIVWAYFDRTLDDPNVFPSPDLTRALVLGGSTLYLVDGEKLERSFVGTVPHIETIQWSPDSPWVLARALFNGNAEFQLINLDDGTVIEWPFAFEPNKVVWAKNGMLVFATEGKVDILVNNGVPSTTDVLKSLLNGSMQVDSGAFELGEYNVAENKYRLLDKVSKELDIDYESIRMGVDPTSGRVFFAEGERVFEVVR